MGVGSDWGSEGGGQKTGEGGVGRAFFVKLDYVQMEPPIPASNRP